MSKVAAKAPTVSAPAIKIKTVENDRTSESTAARIIGKEKSSKLTSEAKGAQTPSHAKGVNAGIQVSGRELVKRYGRDYGTQLGREQGAFIEKAPIVGAPLQKLLEDYFSLKVLGDVFTHLVDSPAFKDFTPQQQLTLKVLKKVDDLYLDPRVAADLKAGKCGRLPDYNTVKNFDAKEFPQMIEALERDGSVQADVHKRTLVTKLKHSFNEGNLLALEDLAGLFATFDVPLSKEQLEKTFNVMVDAGYMDDADRKAIQKNLDRNPTVAHDAQRVCDLLKGELEEENGRIVGKKQLEVERQDMVNLKLLGDTFYATNNLPNIVKQLSASQQDYVNLLAKLSTYYLTPDGCAAMADGKRYKPNALTTKGFSAKDFDIEIAKFRDREPEKHRKELLEKLRTNQEGLNLVEVAGLFHEFGRGIFLQAELLRQILEQLCRQGVISAADLEILLKHFNDNNATKTINLHDIAKVMRPNAQVDAGRVVSKYKMQKPAADVLNLKIMGDIYTLLANSPKALTAYDPAQQEHIKLMSSIGKLYLNENVLLLMESAGKLPTTQQNKIGDANAYEKLLKQVAQESGLATDSLKAQSLQLLQQSWETKEALTLPQLAEVFHGLGRDIIIPEAHLREILNQLIVSGQLILEDLEILAQQFGSSDTPTGFDAKDTATMLLNNVGVELKDNRIKSKRALRQEKYGVPRKGFFQNVDEYNTENERWCSMRLTGQMALAMAAGAERPSQLHYTIAKEDHPATQLLHEYVNQLLVVEPFDVNANEETADITTKEFLKTVVDRTTRDASCAPSWRNLTPATAQRYKSIMQSVKQDPNFGKDKDKTEVVEKLQEAMTAGRPLAGKEIQDLMAAFGKDVKLPMQVMIKMIERLVKDKVVSKDNMHAMLHDLKQKMGTAAELGLVEVQETVEAYAMKTRQVQKKQASPMKATN